MVSLNFLDFVVSLATCELNNGKMLKVSLSHGPDTGLPLGVALANGTSTEGQVSSLSISTLSVLYRLACTCALQLQKQSYDQT